MKDLRQAFLGMLAAVISSLLVLGGLSLAMVESGVELVALISPTPQTPSPTLPPPPTPMPGEPTFTPSPTLPPTPTPTLPVNDTCPPPAGWEAVLVGLDDTLSSLAQQRGTTPEALAAANCLLSTSLFPGTTLYLPPLPTPTPTLTLPPEATRRPTATPQPEPKCGPPQGWVLYTVRPGDTLYGLSLATGVSVAQIQQANCLGKSVVIRVGQKLWLPFIPAVPPTATRQPTRTYTPFPSATIPPRATSTFTPLPSSTLTPSPTATHYPTLTSSPTSTPVPGSPTPTPTPLPSNTPTPTYTLTPTATDAPTHTPEPTKTPQPSDTPMPTNTPTHTPEPSETP